MNANISSSLLAMQDDDEKRRLIQIFDQKLRDIGIQNSALSRILL